MRQRQPLRRASARWRRPSCRSTPARGPRARRRCAASPSKLRAELPDGRFETVLAQPGLRNIVGDAAGPRPGDRHRRPLRHDRPAQGFVGANDAAAAVGAVVELARALSGPAAARSRPASASSSSTARRTPGADRRLLRDALRGSKCRRRLHARRVRAMVLLDYIGNKGSAPARGSSTASLWDEVRAAAKRVGVSAIFPDEHRRRASSTTTRRSCAPGSRRST